MPDKPHADDRDRFAGLHVRLMDALQRYPAERAERRLARIGETLRELRHEVPVDAVRFGVVRLPRHRHEIARKHVRDALAARHHATYGGVPHGHRLAELVESGLHRRDEAVRRELLENLLDLVRPFKGLGHQVLAPERGQGALGPGAHDRPERLHDHVSGLGRGGGDVDEPHASVVDHQKQLLHDIPP